MIEIKSDYDEELGEYRVVFKDGMKIGAVSEISVVQEGELRLKFELVKGSINSNGVYTKLKQTFDCALCMLPIDTKSSQILLDEAVMEAIKYVIETNLIT